MTDALARRRPLAVAPTPLQPLDRLARHLGFASGCLLVKRDDMTGLGGGGNKVRKLEYLCAEAVERGADTLVTGGGRQSNHVRLTAAAANVLGLRCVAVISSAPPRVATGNLLLDHLLGTELEYPGTLDYYELEEAIAASAARVEASGGTPFVVPIGGATAVGALGYVRAALELREQLPEVGTVVVADGSGGTHAGLAAGLGDHGVVAGVNVGSRPDIDEQVTTLAGDAAALAGLAPPKGSVVVDHDQRGPGYGDVTDACREALDLAARLEGLLLDPVYTGKAMAGLIAARRDGRLPADRPTVFLHTGGLPAVFAASYEAWITTWPSSPNRYPL